MTINDPGARPRAVIVLDDKGHRWKAVDAFMNHFSPRRDRVWVWDAESPADLAAELPDWSARYELVGAFVDFSLNVETEPDVDETIPTEDPEYGPYAVTTGIGAMAYLRERLPELPLWAMTSGSSHAALYYAAAWLWFGAHPLNVRDLSKAVRADDGAELFAELMDPALRPIPPGVDESAAEFEQLLTAKNDDFYPAIDNFAWMAAMSSAGHSPFASVGQWAQGIAELAADHARVAPPETFDYRQLASPYFHWNRHLQRMLKYSASGEDLIPEWPEQPDDLQFDASRERRLLRFRDYDFFGQYVSRPENSKLREFFTAQDVYVALRAWRRARAGAGAGAGA